MANNGFKDEIEDMVDDIIKEDKKRIALAFEQIKKTTENKIQEAIKIAMIDNYYEGYEPLQYSRTGQLKKSVAPLTIDESNENGFGFSFGVKTSPPNGSKAMNHSKLTIKYSKKNGETRFYTYNTKNYTPDVEKEIFDNFMSGIHPNMNIKGMTETPTTHVYKEINRELDGLLKDGIIDKIIQDAFSK